MSSCSAGLHYSNSPLGVSARCSGCWHVKGRNLANQIKKVHSLGKGRWWLWKYLNICLFLLSMFEYFACMNMYALHACSVCKQARGGDWIPWKCTYRELLVLGTDTGSSEEATRALKCPAIYTAPWHQDFYKQIQFVSIWKSFFLIIHNHESLSTSELWPFLKCKEDQRETDS